MTNSLLPKKNMLMFLYGSIDTDGRVQRSIESLCDDFKITLVCNAHSQYSCTNVAINTIAEKSTVGTLSLIRFYIEALKIIISNKKNTDVVYVHDYYLPLLGLISSLFSKSILIYDAHELIVPYFKSTNRQLAFYYLERFSILSFNLIVSANVERAKVMKEHYHLKDLPLPVRNISVEQVNKELAFKSPDGSRISILYQGAISHDRRLKVYIDAFQNMPDVTLHFIGDGPEKNELLEYTADIGAKNIFFLGKLDRETLHSKIPDYDIGIVSYSFDDLNNLLCSPNKIFEYSKYGLAMLSTAQETIINLRHEFNFGGLLTQNDINRPSVVKSKIMHMIKNIAFHRSESLKLSEHYSMVSDYSTLRMKIIELTNGN